MTVVQYCTVLYEFMCYLVHKVPGGNSGLESASGFWILALFVAWGAERGEAISMLEPKKMKDLRVLYTKTEPLSLSREDSRAFSLLLHSNKNILLSRDYVLRTAAALKSCKCSAVVVMLSGGDMLSRDISYILV